MTRRQSVYSEVSDDDGGRGSNASAVRRSLRQSVASAVSVVEENIEVGTVGGTVLNTICNVIGAGVLSLPLAFSRLGLVTGSLVCLLMCLDSMFSAFVLFVACERSGEFFMNGVFAAAVLGKRSSDNKDDLSKAAPDRRRIALSMMIDIAVCIYNYLLLTVYCGLMADSATSVLKQFAKADGLWIERWPWIVVSSVIFFALTSARHMAELKWSSLLGIVTIGWAIVVVIAKYAAFHYQGVAGGDDINVGTPTRMAAAGVGVFAVAFGYHVNAPIFYHELQDRTPTKMMKTVNIAFPIIVIAYCAIGCFGYLSFGDSVKGIIVDDYGVEDTVANTVRLGLFFHFACVYPVVSVCLRQTAHRVGLYVCGKREEAESPTMVADQSRWLIVLEAFVSTSSFITYVWTDIGKMVSIIGSLTGNHFIMTIPGAIGMCVWSPAFAGGQTPATDKMPFLEVQSNKGNLSAPVETTDTAVITMPHGWTPPPLWEWRRSIFALSALNVVMGVVFSILGLASDLNLMGS